MKITVIGGGSTYTPELINGFLTRMGTLPVDELVLHDIDAERLNIVGGFAQRMVQAKNAPFKVTLKTDRRTAVAGAAYVITQLRVGGMQARREDEYLGRRHGLVGQETTGVGGMAKALRTIPVVLDIAADIRTAAPDALLVNFTNPSGLITEALARHAPDVASVGVCNAPYNAKMQMLRILADQGIAVVPESAHLNTLGLNHLTWHRGLTVEGEELWPVVMRGYLSNTGAYHFGKWDADTLRILNMIPNYYLEYFYYTADRIAAQQAWPPSRAEQVMEIETRLLRQYAEPDRVEMPEDLMERGGAYYSTVATQLINAHYNDLGEQHVVNVPHRGAVAGWPEDWVLEMPCRVRRTGIEPIPTAPLPDVSFGLLAQIKTYERLTVQAAVNGDMQAAYQALLAHPLGPPADRVSAVLDDLINTHRTYLPRFTQGGKA